MKYHILILCLNFLIAAYVFADENVAVTIDTSIKYQMILGWGAAAYVAPWLPDATKDEILDVAVNDLGLNRLRLEIPGGNSSHTRRWEWFNDNQNPYDLNWDNINTKDFQKGVERVVVPFKNRVEARGEKFNCYVSPSFFDGGSTGAAPVWLINSPGEYSEMALSFLFFLKNKYNIEPDYYCILNEAGNNNPFSASVVGNMIKTLGPAIKKAGFKTTIQFPECVSAQTSWNYIQQLKNDSDIWKYIGMVSYHLYGNNDPYRADIRDFSQTKNLPTGQTEFMGLTMQHLYDDLTRGGVSYWEIYGISSCIPYNYNRITHSAQYWNFRQVMHYVRPGSVRIEAATDTTLLKTLAFSTKSGVVLVMINNNTVKNVTIRNLPIGNYGVSYTISGASYNEINLFTHTGNDKSLQIPANSVMTIYPLVGDNPYIPPAITDWSADVESLILPKSSIKLNVTATCTDLNSLSYKWEMVSSPQGAQVKINNPNSKDASADGLNVAGVYVFKITVSNNISSVSKEVRASVFNENQPPVPNDVHNRNPVQLTLPSDTTVLRGSAWDLEGDKLNFSYKLLKQPEGSNITLDTVGTSNWKMKNIKVAGDYVWQFSASDAYHTVYDTLVIPVYPENKNAPVIQSIQGNTILILPEDSVSLTAITNDLDGDSITHWWSVKSVPAEAIPIIDTPGLPTTMFKNLNVPGDYKFTITAIDRTKMSSQDIKITVKEPSDVSKDLMEEDLQIYPNPANSKININFNLAVSGDVNLFVINSLGEEVNQISTQSDAAGNFFKSLDVSNLGPGIYMLRLSVNGTIKIGKFVIIR